MTCKTAPSFCTLPTTPMQRRAGHDSPLALREPVPDDEIQIPRLVLERDEDDPGALDGRWRVITSPAVRTLVPCARSATSRAAPDPQLVEPSAQQRQRMAAEA